MEIRHLQAMAAAADELHFGRAAARLAITQPALSQQIAQLEEIVEARLFERHPRVALTPAGQLLAERARRILGLVADAESEVRSLAGQSRQRIRVGYLEYWNPPFLATVMRVLRAHDPPIVVEARNLYPREVLAGLRERTIEVGFVHLPIASGGIPASSDAERQRGSLAEPDLASRPVIRGAWAIVLPRAHRLAKKTQLQLADLRDEPIIFFERSVNPPLHAWLLGRFAEAKVAPRIVYSTTQPQVGVDLVSEGVGLFFVGSYVVRALPRSLVMRPIADLPTVQIGAVWRGDERTPAVAALLAALPRSASGADSAE